MSLKTIRILVVDGGSEGGGAITDGGNNKGETTGANKKSKLYKVLSYNETIRNNVKQAVSPTTFFAIDMGLKLAKQTARQAVNYYVSDIGRRNGDSNYQAIVNRNIEIVEDYLSIGSGALSGAGAGAMFGLPGAAIGAVVGAASAGINLGFKYAQRERAYQHEIFQQNNSQAYNLARANYSALTGRVR